MFFFFLLCVYMYMSVEHLRPVDYCRVYINNNNILVNHFYNDTIFYYLHRSFYESLVLYGPYKYVCIPFIFVSKYRRENVNYFD